MQGDDEKSIWIVSQRLTLATGSETNKAFILFFTRLSRRLIFVLFPSLSERAGIALYQGLDVIGKRCNVCRAGTIDQFHLMAKCRNLHRRDVL
jgi:hypothetical protein